MQIVIDIDEYLYKTIKTLGIVVEDGDAVAVSEAIMNGIPLDKIRAEIEEQVLESLYDWFAAEKVNECLEIIDKYTAESEEI